MKILFVCIGNICRSPLAAGILKQHLKEHSLDWQIDSAGLANKYVGCKADLRAQIIAERFGINISNHTARKFQVTDFEQYDMVITMDSDLAERLKVKSSSLFQRNKIWLLTDFLDGLDKNEEVLDPYFMDVEYFEPLYLKIEKACKNIIKTYNVSNTLTSYNATSLLNLNIRKRI